MDDLLSEFITDTQETLEQLDIRLVELENEADGTALLNELFRMMHTIKGTCGFLGLPRMAGLAHAAESLMDRLRNGDPVTHDAIDAMLQVADRLKMILGHIETNAGKEPEGSDDTVIAALNEAGGEGGEGSAAPAAADGEAQVEPAEAAAEAAPAEPAKPAPAPAGKTSAPPPGMSMKPANDSPKPATKAEEKTESSEGTGDRSIRVSVETLEHLMTVVSELVLTRNELTEIMRNNENSNHKLALQRLSTVTGELQQAVMSTRMQPIGNAWRKLPRIVRDVSSSLGKQIELEMSGANTELDRQVLESIKDPLVHMVRNAADHGLEMPDDRVRAGKSEKGKISLNAYHEGGQILVEIADDGRGLDVERIKTKAIERGIATQEDADRMTNEQIFSFIFEPGFSTAATVTSVSGRGVGMDVVQSNVERIGGSIDVQSQQGEGSIFTLKIPLTLAILRALIVGVDNEDFAIPQTSVDELLKVEPGGAHSIQLIKEAPVLRSRDRLLPVVDLRTLLQLPSSVDENGVPRVADESTEGFVMVMRARGMRFGMLVDRVLRTEEIVVKPMPAALRGLENFSGSTILGDGRVIMIVDPNGVRTAASSPSEATMQQVAKQAEDVEVAANKELLLMFRANTPNRKALPISLITRLEDINLADADHSDGQWHIQYNSELIPLVWFGDPPAPGANQRKPLLVMSDAGRSMGLLVDEIVDIVEDSVQVQIPSEQPGILGSAIIGGGAAEVIDVSYFLGLASAHWFDPQHKPLMPGADKILLVDDSIFFRNLVAPVVRSAGYDPVVCASGAEALDKLEGGMMPAVIVTDVDMPEMDGFAFAKAVKRIDRLRSVPLLALTGMITDDAIGRARDAGFDDYISKLDRNGLLQSLRDFTNMSEEIAA
ncbi:chemotaxis protein CheW [Acuticoccus sp. 2012]|uniref:Chemotaxis protein CheA n=2 Tax=Acuticoccus mangrovi TaxID=2796142 RepID=A0A934ILE1_9HYPH|nr:chemotaxis protein CheW [Acuticoccus mangrovi]MBJ3778653.1 chemotaxis protein CheW [Acuticoccus mangrovi]